VREQAGITQTLSDHDRLMVLLVFRSRIARPVGKRHGKSFLSVLHPDLQGYWKFFGGSTSPDVVLSRARARGHDQG
jgi:hypothetical protein